VGPFICASSAAKITANPESKIDGEPFPTLVRGGGPDSRAANERLSCFGCPITACGEKRVCRRRRADGPSRCRLSLMGLDFVGIRQRREQRMRPRRSLAFPGSAQKSSSAGRENGVGVGGTGRSRDRVSPATAPGAQFKNCAFPCFLCDGDGGQEGFFPQERD